jgi:hypothetical protein
VKDYVAGWRLRTKEMFVPLVHPPGHAQADFGEAIGIIGGIERKIHFFAFDLPHSDACFVVGYGNGCNGWKGRFYDKLIGELISGRFLETQTKVTDAHIIAALSLAYLAMVAEFGYVVALMQSGLLMREQFFSPRKFHRKLPLRSQMVLGGQMPDATDARIWAKPFSFGFENMGCVVAARNFAVIVPISSDPRTPIAQHLRVVPTRYKLRPSFKTVFR